MDKHFDLKIESCRENLFSVLNSSGLPMGVINMLVNELQNTVNNQYISHLSNLRAQEKQNEVENNENA